MQLPLARTHEVLCVGEAEGDEQEPRLVHVGVVAIDHRDLGFVGRVDVPQAIGHDRSARAASEDEDSRCHHPSVAFGCVVVIGSCARRRCGHSAIGTDLYGIPAERIGVVPVTRAHGHADDEEVSVDTHGAVHLRASARSADGSLRQEVSIDRGRHVIVTDEPIQLGGGDTGPAPHELFPAALAPASRPRSRCTPVRMAGKSATSVWTSTTTTDRRRAASRSSCISTRRFQTTAWRASRRSRPAVPCAVRSRAGSCSTSG